MAFKPSTRTPCRVSQQHGDEGRLLFLMRLGHVCLWSAAFSVRSKREGGAPGHTLVVQHRRGYYETASRFRFSSNCTPFGRSHGGGFGNQWVTHYKCEYPLLDVIWCREDFWHRSPKIPLWVLVVVPRVREGLSRVLQPRCRSPKGTTSFRGDVVGTCAK